MRLRAPIDAVLRDGTLFALFACSIATACGGDIASTDRRGDGVSGSSAGGSGGSGGTSGTSGATGGTSGALNGADAGCMAWDGGWCGAPGWDGTGGYHSDGASPYDSGTQDASCAAPKVLVYDRPGCDGSVKPVCSGPSFDACAIPACGCDGVETIGCGYYDRPYRHEGLCVDPDGAPDAVLDGVTSDAGDASTD